MNDKRQFERYSCNGSGDLVTGSNARVWGHLGDISLGGFYLSTFGPWPVNTDVKFKLELEGSSICGTGVVTTSHPGVGMAVAFKEMTEAGRETLAAIVYELKSASGQASLGVGLRV